jgi:transcription antitermination factor NusG
MAIGVALRREDVTPPLFPGYVFIWIISQWWSARGSPGVVRIVLDGAAPAKVPDRIIAELRKRERMRAGSRSRDARSVHWVEILLSILGAQQRVTLPKGDISSRRNPAARDVALAVTLPGVRANKAKAKA